jgi:death-on-curing protein
MDLIFLTLEEVLEIHVDQIKRYGGSSGLRDLGLLQSAVATPQASFGGEYLHATLVEMGAAYLFHIVQNHPFIDGNKRVGAATALVFLTMNGVDISVTNDALVQLVLDVAQGNTSKTEIAEFFARNS